MHALFKNAYYWLDLLVGFGSPVLLWVLVRSKIIDRLNWRIFWLGATFGAVWEIPIFLMSKYSSVPIVEWIRYFPTSFAVYMVCHTLWDGALFLVGVWFASLVNRDAPFSRFHWGELAALMAWGQVSAFLVEFSAVTNDAWAFIDTYWWNPPLFSFGDHSVTLMMQLIWLVVTVPFYFILLKVKKNSLSR